MDKQRAKKLLGIPMDIHISTVPKGMLVCDYQRILLNGVKKEWENTVEYTHCDVSLLVREGKFVFRKRDWINDKDIEEETYIIRPEFLNNIFDSFCLDKCDEDFFVFLIDCGYKEILKKKILD